MRAEDVPVVEKTMAWCEFTRVVLEFICQLQMFSWRSGLRWRAEPPSGAFIWGEKSRFYMISTVKTTGFLSFVTEGWLEIDRHYSLELCFSIEKQPETVWRVGKTPGCVDTCGNAPCAEHPKSFLC